VYLPNRRRLLEALALPFAASVARPSPAGERIRLALIGAGGRGKDLLKSASSVAGVEVAVVCDPDQERMRAMASAAESSGARRPAEQHDLRRILDDPSIDGVILTCCNHWHALGAIWAAQAGKHVYVEKPVSHDPAEGQRMVEAARRYRRIVQGGTQRRSSPAFRDAVARLHQGAIGKVYMARWVFTGPRESLGYRDAERPPDTLDWDLWLGPAPQQPYHRNLVHYNWHWFWDFGNGELGNNGVHSMDIVRWGLNKGIPTRIQSAGGRFGYKDQGQTPNTQTATLTYEDGTQILCEIRGLYSGEPTGMFFYGSEGAMHLNPAGGFRIFSGRERKPVVDTWEKDGMGSEVEVGHVQNFVDAIRANDAGELNCEIAEAEISTLLCHLGNISYRLGREVRFDPQKRCFEGDTEADALLARKSRAPFTVPDKV
jgi:predicted dehydrogenase